MTYTFSNTTCNSYRFQAVSRGLIPLSVLLMVGFVFLLSAARVVAADDEKASLKRGQQLYAICSTCHGLNAHGKKDIQAPALAGLSDWYIIEQLKKFQNGQRGAHPADTAGLLMRPMSRTLKNEKDVAAVAAYIASLKPVLPAATIEDGDAAKGQQLYVVCVACHGDKLQGNKDLKTAPLKYTNDWYQLAQLKKYKAGIRGADPSDMQALQMKAIMGGVPDEQTMKNIIAYISQMAKK